MPSVRLKPPSALKNADIAACRSARFGRRAQLAVAGLIDLDRLAVGERDRRVREVGVREDGVDVGRRSGQRRRVGEDLLLGVRQAYAPRGGRCRAGRTRRAPAAARRQSPSRSPRCRSSGPPARCTRPRRRTSRRSAASPAACPAARRRACLRRTACSRRRTGGRAPCPAATSFRGRRPASAGDDPSLPWNSPRRGISAVIFSFCARHAAWLG